MPKKRVLVAMSGGVDSSVALAKILEMGYEAIGITMKLWDNNKFKGSQFQESTCCGIEEITGAKLVCNHYGVSHYTMDFSDSFIEEVVENFVDEYIAGRTPNPCVRCNSFVKWDAFLQKADELGADFIATGHYAQIIKKNNNYNLYKGIDGKKDQSYVLWGIPQHTLARTILPLGNMTKPEVRAYAKKHNLATAMVPESMEICFVADNDYKKFLNQYAPDKMKKIKSGDILQNNEVIGKHNGYTQYTIGQRKGIGVTYPEPRYVKSIDSESNTITISKKEGLYSIGCNVSNLNWLVDNTKLPDNISVKIRYNTPEVDGSIILDDKKVDFISPQLSVTPGQSIVFYNGEKVLGGGIIEKPIK
ncbi:MAG: tRNA 2-thiouridine(34) synthase MnmA [Candidatus Marinimicrobia bacterium]|nr:tRNA 2-thiouridine(34) synthase MnmA [Candidatus Neomarinimicrobiota bacterium]|tara:strand:+ start:202 stop:1284 length:1083 start_codon:yes stop_codon:yes gene_type:complete